MHFTRHVFLFLLNSIVIHQNLLYLHFIKSTLINIDESSFSSVKEDGLLDKRKQIYTICRETAIGQRTHVELLMMSRDALKKRRGVSEICRKRNKRIFDHVLYMCAKLHQVLTLLFKFLPN